MVWVCMSDEQSNRCELILLNILGKSLLLALLVHTRINNDGMLGIICEYIGALAVRIEIKCLDMYHLINQSGR